MGKDYKAEDKKLEKGRQCVAKFEANWEATEALAELQSESLAQSSQARAALFAQQSATSLATHRCDVAEAHMRAASAAHRKEEQQQAKSKGAAGRTRVSLNAELDALRAGVGVPPFAGSATAPEMQTRAESQTLRDELDAARAELSAATAGFHSSQSATMRPMLPLMDRQRVNSPHASQHAKSLQAQLYPFATRPCIPSVALPRLQLPSLHASRAPGPVFPRPFLHCCIVSRPPGHAGFA